MTKTKVEASSPVVYARLSDALKSEAQKMNQIKSKDALSKPKRDPSSDPKDVRRHDKARRSAPGLLKSRNKSSGRRTFSNASSAGDALPKDSGGKTDSSSETSDCTSEENRSAKNLAQTNSLEKGNRGADAARNERWDGGWKFSASGTLEISGDEAHGDLLKEIDDLRSENEYLKDELEELRSEMLEMRDLYMEKEMSQLHELKQQLDQANKTCRILQYRLRKAERRSLHVAQTGQVDGELIRALEHDVRVAKSVSLRLNTELETAQKKSLQLEWENEELRERVQNLEVAKQVLQAEMNKSKEMFSQHSLKRKSLRSSGSKSEKRISQQDDSADLKCQLHFAKEESALMCKKLTKTAAECETMREELSKYRLLYGDVDASQDVAGAVNSAHTRETEVKAHLRLLQEEATLLSRRVVELEVENRGLKAEMNEMREGAGWDREDEGEIIDGREKSLASSLVVAANSITCNRLSEGGTQQMNEAGEENCPLSRIDKDEPADVAGNNLQDQMKSDENMEKEQGRTASLIDLEVLLAVRDQAMLVISIIQSLMSSKNPISKIEVDFHCLNNSWLLEPMGSSLTSGLEMLQAQLCTLVAQIDLMANSMPSKSGHGTDVLGTAKQAAQPGPTEKTTCCSSSNGEQTCNQPRLELLIVQLQWFLQQWRQLERPIGEDKHVLELSSTLLSDLRAAMQELCCELQVEYRAGQQVAQHFEEAKEAWTMVYTQLRSLPIGLEGASEATSADLKMESQKDYWEELEKLLDAAISDVSRQLKMYEHIWNADSQGQLTYLSEINPDWDKQSKDSESEEFESPQKRKQPKRLTQAVRTLQRANKNWIYVSQEAAMVDREDLWKTWDCPVVPSNPPSLKQKTAQKSYTAPEKTSIRIYYSPPSARRIVQSTVRFEDKDQCVKTRKEEEPHCHHFEHINKTNVCETCQDVLPFQCQSATEQGPFAAISNLSSGLKSSGVLYTSCLPFSGWEVSENLSDDMKEMTAGVLERRRRSTSGRRSIGVHSIGTQTHSQPQVNSVGLQTDFYERVCASQHQSPRVPSCVQSQNISLPLERMSEPLEKLPSCSTPPKQQPRHSTSSPYPCKSSSASSTNPAYSFNSVSLSSSSSLEPSKQRIAFGLSQCSASNAKPSSAFGVSTEKSAGCKTEGIHKYGLVQEFLRNVCGRGEKPTPRNIGEKKVPDIHRDLASSARVKKKEGPPSRIPTVPLGRRDSATKMVNHRFMKPGRKDEPQPTQAQTQGQCRNQTRTLMSKGKSLGPATIEVGNVKCVRSTPNNIQEL